MNMKIFNIQENNIDKFFEIIDSCEDKVEIVSNDFKLNLKSNFTKYVSIAKIFFNKEVKEIELVTHNPKDAKKLLDFMMYG